MKKKLLATLLAATMLVGTLTACGSDAETTGKDNAAVKTEESGNKASDSSASDSAASDSAASDNPLRPDTLDTITVVLFGEESPRMQELMENEFQQVFIDEINTKVELMYLPWTEYGPGGKVEMMIASGQEFDMCMLDVGSAYSKGYIQDLTEVIEKYMPEWHENCDDIAFTEFTYDGGIYAFPIGNKPKAGEFYSVCVREDIMKAAGMTEIATIEDLTKYAKYAKEKYGLYATYELASAAYLVRGVSDRNLTSLESALWFDQDTHELINFAESPEFETVVKLYNDWQAQGLIPKDILTNTVTLPFQANMCAIMRGTCGTTKIENEPGLKTIVPEASTKEFFLSPEKPVYKSSYYNAAFQVPVTSKKADRVAMFMNLLQKNSEMANLFAYGVEGTDYELVDGKVSKICTDELFYEWMMYNINLSTPTTAYTDEFMEVYKTWDEGSVPSATYGFTIDYSNIKTEKAQIDSVWTEFATPMLAGLKDYDSNIEELKAQLKKAGWDKYVAEIQSQLDAHFASK